MRVSLCLFLCRYRYAAVLGAWDDLQAQFAAKTNLGSVVAVEGDALEHSKEIAFQLRVPLRDGVAMARGPAAGHSDSLIHGAHQRELLHRRSIDQVLAIQFVTLFVHTGEPFEKMIAVLLSSPFGEDHIDEFIHARTLGPRRVRLWDDNLAHQNNCGVLVRIERAQRVTGSGMRFLKKREELRCERRGNRSRGKKFQGITPLHKTSPIRFLPILILREFRCAHFSKRRWPAPRPLRPKE